MRRSSHISCLGLQRVLCWLLFLLHSHTASSQSIIKKLPGFSGDLPFNLETGYVGVGDLDDFQLFYYFIESARSPENDPLMLWLTGGPCCSSFTGLVYEIGPLVFNYANSTENWITLELNPYSWTKVANIIFIDAPVGTGFSYSKSSRGYQSNDTLYASQTYEFLRKWLMAHPKFMKNSIYIGGDSYSGKIVPLIVQTVSHGSEVGSKPTMNLKGYVLGNPLTYLRQDLNYRVEFAHGMALLSDTIYKSTKRNCKGNYIDVDPNNRSCLNALKVVDKCVGKVSLEHILLPNCHGKDLNYFVEGSVTDFAAPYEQQKCKNDRRKYSNIWMNYKEVQKALKIREGTKTAWARCNRTLPYTYGYESSVGLHRNLTHKFLRALIYSGDHDMTIPYLSTHAWIKSLHLGIEDDWRPWFSNDDQVAGYTIRYANEKYHLTFATVKGGAHGAPEFNPKECFAMISRWFASYNSRIRRGDGLLRINEEEFVVFEGDYRAMGKGGEPTDMMLILEQLQRMNARFDHLDQRMDRFENSQGGSNPRVDFNGGGGRGRGVRGRPRVGFEECNGELESESEESEGEAELDEEEIDVQEHEETKTRKALKAKLNLVPRRVLTI
ncbi:serine carboxypeptidase-like 17 [Ziziphus jujuba]|uniref:Serine carboxypeptidase-like 17 n=1 Tax=Ziziphus jujuba TaxID=326968 RepID=A0ABM3ZRS6_ZIZJJ|nr:serine carboxypeptidase-like 17 [Ziziphus jujuba]